MHSIREVLHNAATAISLGAGFELIAISAWLTFVVMGARWIVS
jgi:hypothetical protein